MPVLKVVKGSEVVSQIKIRFKKDNNLTLFSKIWVHRTKKSYFTILKVRRKKHAFFNTNSNLWLLLIVKPFSAAEDQKGTKVLPYWKLPTNSVNNNNFTALKADIRLLGIMCIMFKFRNFWIILTRPVLDFERNTK